MLILYVINHNQASLNARNSKKGLSLLTGGVTDLVALAIQRQFSNLILWLIFWRGQIVTSCVCCEWSTNILLICVSLFCFFSVIASNSFLDFWPCDLMMRFQLSTMCCLFLVPVFGWKCLLGNHLFIFWMLTGFIHSSVIFEGYILIILSIFSMYSWRWVLNSVSWWKHVLTRMYNPMEEYSY